MITLSCGHQVSDFDQAYDIVTKHYDRMGERALMYSMVCQNCLDLYQKEGILFPEDSVAQNWLLTGE